jgi:hypothetical protein
MTSLPQFASHYTSARLPSLSYPFRPLAEATEATVSRGGARMGGGVYSDEGDGCHGSGLVIVEYFRDGSQSLRDVLEFLDDIR